MKDSIQLEFEDFHKKHPAVYDVIASRMTSLKENGHKRYGLWLFFHELMVSDEWRTIDHGAFKHDYMGRYSRLIMLERPELAGFFETRPLKSETDSPVFVSEGEHGAVHSRAA